MDAAAKQFSKAFDSGMLPMEFVNKMKKDGKLIMGIGHRVKSVSTWVLRYCVSALGNPDRRAIVLNKGRSPFHLD